MARVGRVEKNADNAELWLFRLSDDNLKIVPAYVNVAQSFGERGDVLGNTAFSDETSEQMRLC
jgi:hypothetical protein